MADRKPPKTGALDTSDAVEPGSGGPKPKPEGTYPAIVSTSKLDYSKNGNLMLVLEFSIADGVFAGEKLNKYCVLSGKGAGFTRETLLAFHGEDDLNDGFEVNPRAYLGKPAILDVEKELYTHTDPDKRNKYRDDGKYERSVIKAVLRSDDAEAQAAVAGTLGAEDEESGDTPF